MFPGLTLLVGEYVTYCINSIRTHVYYKSWSKSVFYTEVYIPYLTVCYLEIYFEVYLATIHSTVVRYSTVKGHLQSKIVS